MLTGINRYAVLTKVQFAAVSMIMYNLAFFVYGSPICEFKDIENKVQTYLKFIYLSICVKVNAHYFYMTWLVEQNIFC